VGGRFEYAKVKRIVDEANIGADGCMNPCEYNIQRKSIKGRTLWYSKKRREKKSWSGDMIKTEVGLP